MDEDAKAARELWREALEHLIVWQREYFFFGAYRDVKLTYLEARRRYHEARQLMWDMGLEVDGGP